MEQTTHPLILSSTLLVFPATAVTFTHKQTIFSNHVKKFALNSEDFVLSLVRSVKGEKTPHRISLLAKAKFMEKTNQIYLEGIQRVQVHYIEQNTFDPHDIDATCSVLDDTQEPFPIEHQINFARLKKYYKSYVSTKIDNPIVRIQLLSSINKPAFVIHSLANILLEHPNTQQEILEASNWTQRVQVLCSHFDELPKLPLSPPPPNPRIPNPPSPITPSTETTKVSKHTFRREID